MDGITGTYVFLTSVGTNVTVYSDVNLIPSTEYCYRVRAVNSGGSSGYTPAASATTDDPPPPTAPTNLVVVSVSSTQIDLTWSDNSIGETGFEIERAEDGIGD